MKKTDEVRGQYATEREDSINNARAMIGLDDQPTVEIEAPRTVTERRDGKLVEADKPAFVKIYTSFKSEMKDIDGDAPRQPFARETPQRAVGAHVVEPVIVDAGGGHVR